MIDLDALEKEITFTASFSSGAGGQHVNRTESKATASWPLQKSQLFSEAQKERLKMRLASILTNDGSAQVSSQIHRSLHMNKKECVEKLAALLKKGLFVPKKRKKTKPTKSSQKKRVDHKKHRGKIKSGRSGNWT